MAELLPDILKAIYRTSAASKTARNPKYYNCHAGPPRQGQPTDLRVPVSSLFRGVGECPSCRGALGIIFESVSDKIGTYGSAGHHRNRKCLSASWRKFFPTNC